MYFVGRIVAYRRISAFGANERCCIVGADDVDDGGQMGEVKNAFHCRSRRITFRHASDECIGLSNDVRYELGSDVSGCASVCMGTWIIILSVYLFKCWFIGADQEIEEAQKNA